MIFSLCAPIAGMLIQKIGLKTTILIRTPLFIFSLMGLIYIKDYALIENNYLLIAFLLGFSGIIYTISITSLFSKFVDTKKMSEETSKFISLPQL